jgi:hypothetical protein
MPNSRDFCGFLGRILYFKTTVKYACKFQINPGTVYSIPVAAGNAQKTYARSAAYALTIPEGALGYHLPRKKNAGNWTKTGRRV